MEKEKTFAGFPSCVDLAQLQADIALIGIPYGTPYAPEKLPHCLYAPDAIRRESNRYRDDPVAWDFIPFDDKLIELAAKADAICLAEYAINMDLRRETTLFVMVDHGLGMSVLREGELWHGDATVSGEMGHLIVDAAGTICKCGQRGCLETIASSDAIVDKVRANLRPSDAAALGLDNQTLNLEQVIAAAGRGNKLAKLAIREAAEAVGAVAAQVLVILGIEKVIFAGRIAKAGVIFADPFEATIRHLCMDPLNRSVTIVAARATGHPFAQGAAFAALERHFVGHHEGEPNGH